MDPQPGLFPPSLTTDISSVFDRISPDFIRVLMESGSSEKAGELARLLTVGQLLSAQVLDVGESAGVATLALRGKEGLPEAPVRALTGGSVQKGQALDLRVEQVRPSIILSRIGESLTAPGAMDDRVLNESPAIIFKTRPVSSPKVDTPLPRILSRAEADALGLKEEQTVAAKVTGYGKNGEVHVRIENREFAVEIPSGRQAPEPGARIDLRLLPVEEGYAFEISPDAGRVSPLSILQAMLTARKPLGEILLQLEEALAGITAATGAIRPDMTGRLIETLSQLLTASPDGLDQEKVRQLIDATGIRYEAKIAQALSGDSPGKGLQGLNGDLKWHLLDMQKMLHSALQGKGLLEPEHTGRLQELLRQVNASLDHVESLQLSNYAARRDDHPLLLQLPLPFLAGDQTLKIYVRRDGAGRSAEKNLNSSCRVVFFLEMQHLGPLRVDVLLQEQMKKLSVTFNMQREDAMGFLQLSLDEFRNQLRSAGYEVDVSCRLRSKSEAEVFSEPDRGIAEFASMRLVDIKT